MDRRRVDELGISYVRKLSLYEEYASRIRNLIQDLIEREGVAFQSVEGWAARPNDLISTLAERDEDEIASLDLVTVRVLLRLPEDVYRVERIVVNEFAADLPRSVPSNGRLLTDPYRFGYPAVSYVLSLSDDRASLREWEKYRGLSFRLELRTMIQDAWAAIEPSARMTLSPAADMQMKRRMFRIAMLLEEADERFLELWNEMKDEALLVPPSAEPRSDTPPVTAERTFSEEELYNFFKEDIGLMSRWDSIAKEAGFPEFEPDSSYLRASFGYMCTILRAAGIDTFSEVRAFLSEVESGGIAERQLRTVCSRFKDAEWRVDPFSAIFMVVLNLKWDILKDKDLVGLGIKRGNDRITGRD